MKIKTDIKAGYAKIDLETLDVQLDELRADELTRREEMDIQKPDLAFRTGQAVAAILE